MSRDRFISFTGIPLPVNVVKELQEYGGDIFRAVTWMGDGQRAIINLHGRFEKYGDSHPRWIEVVYGGNREDARNEDNTIDVLTREMDGPTNALADDVARFLARRFKGKLDPADFPKNETEEVAGNRSFLLSFSLRNTPAVREALDEVRGFCEDRAKDLKHDVAIIGRGTAHEVISRVIWAVLRGEKIKEEKAFEAMMSKPLTFSELKVGDHFIAFPQDGDDSGHGGHRRGSYVFKKTSDCVKGNTHDNSLKLTTNTGSNMPAGMRVLKVIL